MLDQARESEPSSRLKAQVAVSRVLAAAVQLTAYAFASVFLFSLANRYFFLAELISSFRCQLLILIVFLGVALMLLGRWRRGVLLTAIGMPFLLSLLQVYLPVEQPPAGPEQLRIMAMNVLTDNWQYDEVMQHVREVKPDVVLLLEYSHGWHEHLKPQLAKLYGHQRTFPRWHGYGIGVFSKSPLQGTECWQLTRGITDVPALVTEVAIGQRWLRLAGLHTMSPTNNKRLVLRNRQMAEMGERLSDRQVPTMMMGDFNCTPWASAFGDLIQATGYRDSRAGQGYLASWNMGLPRLMRIPIDHALVSEDVHVHHRTVGRPCGSDHRPTIIEVSVAEDLQE